MSRTQGATDARKGKGSGKDTETIPVICPDADIVDSEFVDRGADLSRVFTHEDVVRVRQHINCQCDLFYQAYEARLEVEQEAASRIEDESPRFTIAACVVEDRIEFLKELSRESAKKALEKAVHRATSATGKSKPAAVALVESLDFYKKAKEAELNSDRQPDLDQLKDSAHSEYTPEKAELIDTYQAVVDEFNAYNRDKHQRCC